jgi:lysozyme family protein
MSFERAVANVLKHEGGFSDNPNDAGGMTRYGISQHAYPKLDIKTLTLEQATGIYRTDYWAAIQGDELPAAVGFALLDWAVNSGVTASIQGLQRALKLPADGLMGPQTIAACSHPGVVTLLSVERIYTLTGLKAWTIFGKGWAARVIDTAVDAFQA